MSQRHWTTQCGWGWFIPVWSSEDKTSNLIQIKRAVFFPFFFFSFYSCVTFYASSRNFEWKLMAAVDYCIWTMERLCSSCIRSIWNPLSSLEMHARNSFVAEGGNERNCNAVIWFVYLFIYFYLICCFPLSNVNNTWKIQEKIWEDGCCVWVRETLLLPSSWSWSSCTHTKTSGAYVTLGQKDARSSPRSSDVLICDTISTCFYLTVLSPHGRAHTLTEMSSQAAHLCEEWIGHHLCVWVLEVKELLTKKSMCVWEFNRKQRGRRVIYRKQFQSGEWPFTVHFVH